MRNYFKTQDFINSTKRLRIMNPYYGMRNRHFTNYRHTDSQVHTTPSQLEFTLTQSSDI